MTRLFAIVVALATAGTPAGADPGSGAPHSGVDGQCRYAYQAVHYAPHTAFVACNHLDIARGPGEGSIDFSQRDWGSFAHFRGQFDGDVLRVSYVRLRGEGETDARGTCRLSYDARGVLQSTDCAVRTTRRPVIAHFEAVD